jgi:hypothetical protein
VTNSEQERVTISRQNNTFCVNWEIILRDFWGNILRRLRGTPVSDDGIPQPKLKVPLRQPAFAGRIFK